MTDLLCDRVVFPAVQIGFFILAGFALAKDHGFLPKKGATASLTTQQGPDSWKMLWLAYGALSAILLGALNMTQAFTGYKTAVTITDLALLVYLCFFNNWIRELIVRVIHASQNKVDRR